MAELTIRPGRREDLPQIVEIQRLSPQSSQWTVEDYLLYDLTVAVRENTVAGFIVACALAENESEILNLAVHPSFRRQGIASRLFESVRSRYPGQIYLEVRESNHGAQRFYTAIGFKKVASRPEYYENESAVVMKYHSC